MTFRRLVFRTYIRLLEKLCLLHPVRKSSCYNLSLRTLPEGNGNTDIVTVAFNNDKIIPLHIQYVSKYYKDEHTHIIADNSTDMAVSVKIRDYCREHGVSYIRLPKNMLEASYSHATALNWVCKHVVRKRRPACFGFIDHDLFPIKEISLIDILKKQHVYGPLRLRGSKYWYLSAILCFFDFSFVNAKKIDFMPVRYDEDENSYLDTGGGNWPGIYSLMDKSKMRFCSERLENYREGDNRHQDQIEIFDDSWLHTINGSYWKKICVEKENVIPELINKYEK